MCAAIEPALLGCADMASCRNAMSTAPMGITLDQLFTQVRLRHAAPLGPPPDASDGVDCGLTLPPAGPRTARPSRRDRRAARSARADARCAAACRVYRRRLVSAARCGVIAVDCTGKSLGIRCSLYTYIYILFD